MIFKIINRKGVKFLIIKRGKLLSSNPFVVSEPMSRFELPTSSLPRKRSTPELHRLNQKESERPGSNRRHSAWKADALPTELLSLIYYFKSVLD